MSNAPPPALPAIPLAIIRAWAPGLALALALAAWSPARAAPGCGALPGSSIAARIATVACRENALWHSPFIDADGRLASMTVVEAEAAPLTDGTPAWQRVAGYWRESGLLPRMAGFEGAAQCMAPVGGSAAWCRSFIVDRPWSAAFVSWVMVQAGLPGFRPSPSHVDYVRAAFAGADSPWRFADPDAEPAAVGDLLCFVRVAGRQYGHAGLAAFLRQPGGSGLPMHCDIVVAADRARGMLHLVGGNLLQGVTLRMIPIDRNGLPRNLPRGPGGPATDCWPANPAACSFNRQDWAALLKLRPEHELALLPPPRPVVGPPATAPQPQCCVYCVVGAGVPRCPKPGADIQPPPGDD